MAQDAIRCCVEGEHLGFRTLAMEAWPRYLRRKVNPQVKPLTPKESVAMPFQTRYLFSAAMDVEPAKEALFNDVYDTEHVPNLLKVPGVIAVARFKSGPVTMMLGGERRTIVIENEPRYNALYEVESPDVLVSPAWAKAVEEGRWPGQVRAYTKNRRHVMFERIF
jgi:hypothetical protein